ncbi:hypothetical protein SAMN04488544_3006 [Microlunatus sagamiharensis]|uniref:Uncharacterized protein n=1 Tax=Microlunatus sagamiharensis TaxID=546874 RepID=A0A1H2MYQ9_9ACTN|nr:hypothetical protein [Microlunatus sagamiharensis]SDU98503.1 hypothetical protein SAMN04488544_3006 [Microlunatus sagamiharensis]
MFSSFNARKAVRVAATSTVAGAALALVFLGAPADAATVAKAVFQGRGY